LEVVIAHRMDDTLTLRVKNTRARREIVRHGVIALAVRAGLPPLAASRAGTAVGEAASASDADELTVTAAMEAAAVRLRIDGGDGAWCDATVARLADYDATPADGGVALRLQRTPLRSV
jgi:hypothetical protein